MGHIYQFPLHYLSFQVYKIVFLSYSLGVVVVGGRLLNIPYKNLKYYTFAQDKKFTLENGQQLGPIDVAYETFGTLSSQKDNAVLIIHALTGDTHVTSAEDENTDTPGWWDTLVGCGKSIDTNTHFVICANVLGGCMGTTGPLQ